MRFEELLVGELGWLARLARRFYTSDADAEDLLGETVCRMIENKDKYAEGLPFRPWAKAVMSNIYITAYNRRKCVLMRPIEGCECAACVEADATAEIGSLLVAISRLASKYVCVEAVRLYALGGLSYDEAAKAMGVGVDVIRTRIATGRRIIKKVLGIVKY